MVVLKVNWVVLKVNKSVLREDSDQNQFEVKCFREGLAASMVV